MRVRRLGIKPCRVTDLLERLVGQRSQSGDPGAARVALCVCVEWSGVVNACWLWSGLVFAGGLWDAGASCGGDELLKVAVGKVEHRVEVGAPCLLWEVTYEVESCGDSVWYGEALLFSEEGGVWLLRVEEAFAYCENPTIRVGGSGIVPRIMPSVHVALMMWVFAARGADAGVVASSRAQPYGPGIVRVPDGN